MIEQEFLIGIVLKISCNIKDFNVFLLAEVGDGNQAFIFHISGIVFGHKDTYIRGLIGEEPIHKFLKVVNGAWNFFICRPDCFQIAFHFSPAG